MSAEAAHRVSFPELHEPSALRGRDFLALDQFERTDLDRILALARAFKRMGPASRRLDLLDGKTLLTLFFRASTRTRLSFAAAMQQLGGFVQCPDAQDMRLNLDDCPGKGESLKDTARVVERYVDAVAIRVGGAIGHPDAAPRPGRGDQIMAQFAHWCGAPVINMGSDLHHPTQALADLMVMQEQFGDLQGKKLVVMWAYTPALRNLVSPLSCLMAASMFGMHCTLAHPPGFDLDAPTLERIRQVCRASHGRLEVAHELGSALSGAHVVFARNWWSPNYYVNTVEEELRLAQRYRDWRLTRDWMARTEAARFIHCMPFDRGLEVDDDVVDGPHSLVYDQAENLLHVRKALLAHLLADERQLRGLA